jgi:uncharacterized membrane protein YjdF
VADTIGTDFGSEGMISDATSALACDKLGGVSSLELFTLFMLRSKLYPEC